MFLVKMGIQCAYLFLVSLCILEIVQLTPVPYRKLSKTELNQIALKCIDDVKIDKSVIEEVLRTQILPSDNRKYKKYLACSYKKQGFLSLDGTKMNYDNLYEFLQDFYESADLETLDYCKQIQEDDAGELCFQNLDCILNGLRKLDAKYGFEEENKIESNTI